MLHLAQYWYNTTFHTSVAMTPFEELYGRDPPSLTRVHATSDMGDSPAALYIQSREKILEQL